MTAVLLLAAPVLEAPDDPGTRGLWSAVALILLIGLVAAHVRVLRAVSRQARRGDELPGRGPAGAELSTSEASAPELSASGASWPSPSTAAPVADAARW